MEGILPLRSSPTDGCYLHLRRRWQREFPGTMLDTNFGFHLRVLTHRMWPRHLADAKGDLGKWQKTLTAVFLFHDGFRVGLFCVFEEIFLLLCVSLHLMS